MNRKFRKAIQDTFVMPEEKRMEEFLAELEGLPAGKRKPVWAKGFAVASAAAAFLLFTAGIGLTLKLHPKPDTNVPGTEIVTETVPSVQPETTPEEYGTAAEETTRPQRATTKAVSTEKTAETGTSAAAPTQAVQTVTQQSQHNAGIAQPANTSAGKNPITTPATTVTAPVTSTVQTVPVSDNNNTRPKTLEEKEQIIMKVKKLAAVFAAAAIGSGSTPVVTNAEATPAHRLDRLQKYEEYLDLTGDGKLTIEDVYYYYLGIECTGGEFNSAANFPPELEAGIRKADFTHTGFLITADALQIVEYFVDQNISTNEEIDALYDTPVTYLDWKNGPIPTVAFDGTVSDLDFSQFYNMLVLQMKRDLKSPSIAAAEEVRIQAMFSKIKDGVYDLDLNCDGITDTRDIACGDFFIEYLREEAPDVLASTERLGLDELSKENVASLFAPVAEYRTDSGFSQEVWNKCVSFLEGVTESGYDYRQFEKYMFIYASDAFESFEDDLSDYCAELAEATGHDYTEGVMISLEDSISSARFTGLIRDFDHYFRYETKFDADLDDPNFDDNVHKAYTNACAAFEAGDLSKIDVNNDGSINYLDYFLLEVYTTDMLLYRLKENSILPEEIWNRIDNDLDISGNGISGDWVDVYAIEDLVYLHGSDWDDDVEQSINNIFGKALEAETIVATMLKNTVCADKEQGDVDLDGMVSADDASEVLSYYASCSVNAEVGIAESARMSVMGDIDSNGRVSADDASAILSIYAQHSVE